ncbi:hyoscyamine 6-dioxygenase-like [Camellia sinensis]|uniref:hyoscyamine 6-dioxygenase-like n=1 Tax=Camellia sinensis TaxID=4442 RepID=UPI001035F67A|nr:hyoscyamine 6-dioxygenase-like [Camellia sinensis]
MAKASTYQSSTLISTAIFGVRVNLNQIWKGLFVFRVRLGEIVNEKILSVDVHTVPANYVFPPEERPGDLAAPLCKDIPVIDLRQVGAHDQADLLQQIMKGSQDFGMFQEFFDMPTKDKATYYSEDKKRLLGHSVEVKKLSLRILDLICEGLGVEAGYFADELSKIQGLVANHYPSCPNPSLVLGLGGHCDPNLLTILQQVYGLQIFKDEQWVSVEPPAHAFVINTANQLEIISNGKLKSAKHRAVTNSSIARTSIVSFISPSRECLVEPSKALVSAYNPPLFKAVRYKEFSDTYICQDS